MPQSRRYKTRAMLPLSTKLAGAVLLLLASVVAAQNDVDVFQAYDQSTGAETRKVEFQGRSPSFKLFPTSNASKFIQMRLSSFLELDNSSRPLAGRKLEPAAGRNSAWATGSGALLDSTGASLNYTFVQYRTTVTSLSTGCSQQQGGNQGNNQGGRDDRPNGSQHNDSSRPQRHLLQANSTGEITVTFLFGFSGTHDLQYGTNNTVRVRPDSFKMNVEVKSWPFCAPTNQLRVELELKTASFDAPRFANVTDGSYDDGHESEDEGGEHDSGKESGQEDSGKEQEQEDSGKEGASNSTSREMVAVRRLLSMARALLKDQSAGTRVKVDAALNDVQINSTDGDTERPDSGKGRDGSKDTKEGDGDTGSKDGASSGPRNTSTTSSSSTSKGQNTKTGKRALLPIGDGFAADLQFLDYAFNSVNGSTRYPVGLMSGGQGGKTVMLLTFPAAASIYYDPDVYVAQTGAIELGAYNATTFIDPATAAVDAPAAPPPAPLGAAAASVRGWLLAVVGAAALACLL